MPTYEYACRSCDTHLEVVQRFDDDPLTECPSCGGQLRKVFGSIGISFKGSGFYKTDSRALSKTGAPSKAASGDGESPATSTSGDGATSTSADGSSSTNNSSGADAAKESKAPKASTSTPAPSTTPATKSA